MAKLENSKWIVEKQKNPAGPIEVHVTDFKQAVFISKNEGTVVVVKGKVNSIVVEGSKTTNVVFDDVVSGVEIINCQKVNIQANGTLPTLNVEKSAGVNVYLQTPEAKKVEVVTASATEVNLILPGPTPDSDPKEYPIPSQFLTKFEGDKTNTKPVEHSAN